MSGIVRSRPRVSSDAELGPLSPPIPGEEAADY